MSTQRINVVPTPASTVTPAPQKRGVRGKKQQSPTAPVATIAVPWLTHPAEGCVSAYREIQVFNPTPVPPPKPDCLRVVIHEESPVLPVGPKKVVQKKAVTPKKVVQKKAITPKEDPTDGLPIAPKKVVQKKPVDPKVVKKKAATPKTVDSTDELPVPVSPKKVIQKKPVAPKVDSTDGLPVVSTPAPQKLGGQGKKQKSPTAPVATIVAVPWLTNPAEGCVSAYREIKVFTPVPVAPKEVAPKKVVPKKKPCQKKPIHQKQPSEDSIDAAFIKHESDVDYMYQCDQFLAYMDTFIPDVAACKKCNGFPYRAYALGSDDLSCLTHKEICDPVYTTQVTLYDPTLVV